MKLIVAALVSTCVIGAAAAQTPSPTGAQPSAMMKSDAKRDAGVEQHIAELHSKLKITASEESKWNDVAATMRANAAEMDSAIDKREAGESRATAIDSLNSYAEIARAHADGVKKLASSFSSLYSMMSDDQKKLADETFSHREHAGKKLASQ
jgi:periplasmic protein CpxP/Spy